MTDNADSQTTSGADIREEGSAVRPWGPGGDRRAAAFLFVVVVVIYLFTASYTTFQNHDSRATAHAAWSLGTRGTLALPDHWDPADVSWDVVVEGDDGRERLHVWRFPGAILWAAPYYAVWSWVSDSETPAHPDDMNYVPAGIAAATAAALAVTVSFLLFRRLVGRRTAAGAALVLAFATSVWSISGNALWTHAFTHLGLAGGLLAVASGRHALGGSGFAFSILARPQTAVVAAVIGLYQGLSTRSVRPVIAVGATSALGVVALSVYSQLLYGTWVPVAGYPAARALGVATTGASTFGGRILDVLIDPYRGLLIYAPFLVVLMLGVRRAWAEAPAWVRSSAVAGVVYLLVQLRVNPADGGTWFFAYRLPIEMLVLGAPLLVLAWQQAIAGRRLREVVFLCLVAFSVGLQALGVTTYSAAWFAEVRRAATTEQT